MANHVLSLCSLFCVQYSLHKHFTTVSITIEQILTQLYIQVYSKCIHSCCCCVQDVAIRHCLAVESTYLSLFHPFSLLRREASVLFIEFHHKDRQLEYYHLSLSLHPLSFSLLPPSLSLLLSSTISPLSLFLLPFSLPFSSPHPLSLSLLSLFISLPHPLSLPPFSLPFSPHSLPLYLPFSPSLPPSLSSFLSLPHSLSLYFPLSTPQLAECNNTLAQWLSIPLPCHHRQESEKCGSITDHLSQATELVQQFYLSILGSLADSTQSKMVECSERGRFDGLVVHVWSSLSTLFVAREQLELVGIMRRIVSHTTRAVGQVSVATYIILTINSNHTPYAKF